ncbi:4,5:9,10-diseco-3-hydroxy-5,9,17-trioxoandrosta-1(10),2-diene-4-oate hydrolase [Nonomuraea thailandensis]|uniref:4,5:9,10-diseco-3-hydroxy-5,9, 17-trioxoandrosta-1(10),2-diene-4-oate hydrolase n=1 Tax=Nonomuraea thailandensis TaxID=1188745 RepID=A0A9X2GH09_9ACTN|nr:alpha/beta hydrolase [Nonomuraea thailandensis]MCP2358412.1 4,5:9,10-diseco-3-hydroxy-5,9,17-trioxoandrosta-1(10),2-diene-4-oate hydrolase [Nonomuraea thailandensis]
MVHLAETPERLVRRRPGRRWPRWAAVAVALLVAVTLFGAYGWQPAAVDGHRSAYEGGYLDTPQARFHYSKTGSGSPVVLVAGGAQWLYSYRDTIPELAREHTVYAVDLPGQGYTTVKGEFAYDIPAMAQALGSFLDAAGLSTVSLVGHSWGGAWSLYYAEHNPARVDRLVLLDSPGLDKPLASQTALFSVPVVGELAVKLMGRADFEKSLRTAFAHQDRVTAETVDETWHWMSRPDKREAFVSLVRTQDYKATDAGLARLRARTLVIWGQADQWLPAAYAQEYGRRIPGATVKIVPGAGHNVHEDAPEQVNPLLTAFLKA